MDLVSGEPSWGLELLMARIAEPATGQGTALERGLAALSVSEHTAGELARQASAADPWAFVNAMVPFLRTVIAKTAHPCEDDDFGHDPHFSWRFPEPTQSDDELGDVFFAESIRALETLATSTPDRLRPLLEVLADDRLYSCQFLLYKTLAAGGLAYAEWAAELLLEEPARLSCGYLSDHRWAAREVVAAIAPHVGEATHRRLEDRFRDWWAPGERPPWVGTAAFSFLSALDEHRLTAPGRRRLAEYRRKFGVEAPAPPTGVQTGTLQSPIEDEATRRMSDEQWLRAMRRYSAAEADWDDFKGGAHQLAQALRQRVTENPQRFARLALRFTEDLNLTYADSILIGLGDADIAPADAATVFEAVRGVARLGHQGNDRWLGWALRPVSKQVPTDIVELLCQRARESSDPRDSTPASQRDGSARTRSSDLRVHGMNTGRGSAAGAVGDVLLHDVDGALTGAARPHLAVMASDPVLSVRACVAHALVASLRHARPEAVAAFKRLIDADDALLAADSVQRLMIYIGNVDPDPVVPVVQRMLTSEDDAVRAAGGGLAAFAALEWDRIELLQEALDGDGQVRQGVGAVCSGRIALTSNATLAIRTLLRLFHDPCEGVRVSAAKVATELRGRHLGRFGQLIWELIASPAYRVAMPQLLITLQHAPDRVDGFVVAAAQRFLQEFGVEAANISTGASADAHHLSDLVIRGLSQARQRDVRSTLLDILDGLLENGVYGIDEAITNVERS